MRTKIVTTANGPTLVTDNAVVADAIGADVEADVRIFFTGATTRKTARMLREGLGMVHGVKSTVVSQRGLLGTTWSLELEV